MKKNILLSILTIILALGMIFLIGASGYLLYNSYKASQEKITSFAEMQQIKDDEAAKKLAKEKEEKAKAEAEAAAAAAAEAEAAAAAAAETETEEELVLEAFSEDGSVLIQRVDKIMITNDAVNIRESYDTEAEVINSVDSGVEVQVKGILYSADGQPNGWAQISIPDVADGYMSTDFLMDME